MGYTTSRFCRTAGPVCRSRMGLQVVVGGSHLCHPRDHRNRLGLPVDAQIHLAPEKSPLRHVGVHRSRTDRADLSSGGYRYLDSHRAGCGLSGEFGTGTPRCFSGGAGADSLPGESRRPRFGGATDRKPAGPTNAGHPNSVVRSGRHRGSNADLSGRQQTGGTSGRLERLRRLSSEERFLLLCRYREMGGQDGYSARSHQCRGSWQHRSRNRACPVSA